MPETEGVNQPQGLESEQDLLEALNNGLERDLREIYKPELEDGEAETKPETDGGRKEEPESGPTKAVEDGGAPEGEPSEAQQPPEGEPPEVQQPPEDPVIDYRGRKVKLSEIEKWERGHMLQEDYTRKTQALAEERRKLQAAFQHIQQYITLERMLQSNPQLMQAFQQSLQDAFRKHPPQFQPVAPVAPMAPFGTPAAPVGQAALPPDLQSAVQEIQDMRLEQRLQQVRRQADADRKSLGLPPLSDSEWESVENRILKIADESKLENLELAYRATAVHSEWAQAALQQRQAESKAQEQKRQKAAQVAGQTLNGSPRGAGPSNRRVPKDFDEAVKLAATEGNLGLFVSG